uniref:ORF78 n=1 Tax=Pinus koraiensis TaxID=88728 RepID=A4QMC8_PINKO|nr:ORF78 [Pinus koraiensis]
MRTALWQRTRTVLWQRTRTALWQRTRTQRTRTALCLESKKNLKDFRYHGSSNHVPLSSLILIEFISRYDISGIAHFIA